jgi:membrane fusion protein, multidrug efflux system
MKRWKPSIAWTSLWMGAVLLGGCRDSTSGPPAPAGAPAAPVEVRVAHPRRGEITRSITLTATVAPYQEATLYAKVAGYLKSISVDKGDAVQDGAVLAEIEVPELSADLAGFKAEVEVAEIEHRRIAEAQARSPDLVVPQAVDAARGRLDVARARLQRVETLLGFAKITAPFPGVVTGRWVDPGAFIPAATSGSAAQNAAVVKVMDFSKVRVQVPVPEPEAPWIADGLPVQVTVAELPGRTFEGAVTRFTHSLDPVSRTMMAEIELPNPREELRPGMFARATIAVERKSGALLVPSGAVVREKSRVSVFVLSQGAANKVPIKPGFGDSASVEVLEGLKEDAAVIIPGGQAISDGQPVRQLEAP